VKQKNKTSWNYRCCKKTKEKCDAKLTVRRDGETVNKVLGGVHTHEVEKSLIIFAQDERTVDKIKKLAEAGSGMPEPIPKRGAIIVNF